MNPYVWLGNSSIWWIVRFMLTIRELTRQRLFDSAPRPVGFSMKGKRDAIAKLRFFLFLGVIWETGEETIKSGKLILMLQ